MYNEFTLENLFGEFSSCFVIMQISFDPDSGKGLFSGKNENMVTFRLIHE